jgi:hypothetical protein
MYSEDVPIRLQGTEKMHLLYCRYRCMARVLVEILLSAGEIRTYAVRGILLPVFNASWQVVYREVLPREKCLNRLKQRKEMQAMQKLKISVDFFK